MSEFQCPSCSRRCCTCQGCSPAVTNGGKQCCSMCVGYAQAIENENLHRQHNMAAIHQADSRKSYLSQVPHIQRMSPTRPGELK